MAIYALFKYNLKCRGITTTRSVEPTLPLRCMEVAEVWAVDQQEVLVALPEPVEEWPLAGQHPSEAWLAVSACVSKAIPKT